MGLNVNSLRREVYGVVSGTISMAESDIYSDCNTKDLKDK